MNKVLVNEVVRRYHVSQSQRDYKERLDRLTENLIREYLEVALDNAGCRPSDILCIRYLNIPISFDPDKTDFEIFAVWLNTLENAIKNLLAEGHQQQWLNYPSKIEALISVARSLSNSQLDDQWAWQQMGIIPKGQHSVVEVKIHWMNYLAQHIEYVPAVFAGSTKDNTIHRLINTHILDSKDIHKLLLLNSNACGMSAKWHDIFVNVRKSLSFDVGKPSKSEGQVIATLSMLNTSWRALFNGSELGSFITEIFHWSTASQTKMESLVEKLQLFYALILVANSSAVTQVTVSQHRVEGQLISWLNDFQLCLASQSNSNDDNAIEDKSIQREVQNMQPLDMLIAEQPSKLVGYFGGVLFLFNLLKENNWRTSLTSLIEQHDSPIAVLTRLCIILLPEIKQDTVLSVFTGAISAEVNQATIDYRFSPEELTKLNQFADSIKLEITTRLTGDISENVETIFTEFSRKKVEIEFAAGWVKVFYSLDDADTRVRASGLDLDPGFIPWLGYMVTFYYE